MRTLTKARDVHHLSMEEARRGYPVRLHAVATYYASFNDPRHNDSRHGALFVHDASGSVFVNLSSPPPNPIVAGTLIEVTGISDAGYFAPIVNGLGVRVVGKSRVPTVAPRVSLNGLLTGKYDAAWIEVEGVVRSVREAGRRVNLSIALSDGSLVASTIREDGADYRPLVDAKITLRGNASPIFNGKRQMTGAQIVFPDLKQVKIEEPATIDPFRLPALPIERLLSYTPDIAFQKLVRARGGVSLQWPGRSLCIQDETIVSGLCVQTSETARFANGELVDIVGFPAIGGMTPTLTDTRIRSAGPGQIAAAASVTAEQAIHGDFDARLVQIEGRLIGKDRTAKDPTMVLSSDNFLFHVVLPDRHWTNAVPDWERGSTIRVTGICSVQIETTGDPHEGLSVPKSFRILLRSPEDVVVLQRPSWWTPRHLVPLLVGALAITLCVLGWVVILRHRIAEQTAVIRKQNVILRNLSFKDGLTGIPNRRKFDETLDTEFTRCARSMSPVSLLVLDIDHFKDLNDEYGHQRGDECLKRVAEALMALPLRDGDLVARYGGEEFAVVLPGCDEHGAMIVAERMRVAVLDLAIAHRGSSSGGCLSISVGSATMVPDYRDSAKSLVAMADRALYQAKLLGRNRTSAAAEGCLRPS
jgi:diguanylate cyclase (GGDEF)-like protein